MTCWNIGAFWIYERAHFTGAIRDKMGKFGIANKGTLMLVS